MLYLIGLGLVDDDVSLKSIEIMKQCDEIYCELYTNKWMGDLKKLEHHVGKKIQILSRIDVENNIVLDRSVKKDVALLISGDPLTATTHFELAMEAKNLGIKYEIIHAPSIYTAVANTGLQLYKFGRTTTLVFPEKNYLPTSPYDVIERNLSIGLHTLVLLDIQDNRQMSIKDALNILIEIEKEKNKSLITMTTKVVACCQLGGADEIIRYGTIEQLIKDDSLIKTPAAIIIPGDLNFKEEEALALWM